MKYVLLLLTLFQFTNSYGQWDLIASQPVVPDQLAIDSCGNAFARVENRIYRSIDLGQTWERGLDLPSILDPSFLFTSSNGNVHASIYSTQSGVVYDYRFACDGSVDVSNVQLGSNCDELPFEVTQKENERLFTTTITAGLGVVTTFGLAVDEGLGNGLQLPPTTIAEPYYYQLDQTANGYLEFSAHPEIMTSSTALPPSIVPLDILDQGWRVITGEQVLDLSFSDYSMVVSKDSNSLTIALAIATYSVFDQEWSTKSIDPLGFQGASTVNHDHFLIEYSDRLELRDATGVGHLVATVIIPSGFVVRNCTEDLSYVIGEVDGHVMIIHNDIATTTSLPEEGFPEWSVTTLGSIIRPSHAGFEEFSGNSGTSAVQIDLDAEVRYVSADTVGSLVYLVRQLNNRSQLLVENLDGSLNVVVDSLAGESKISGGGDVARIIRIGYLNFVLEAGEIKPFPSQFSRSEIEIHGADTLYVNSEGDSVMVNVSRNGEITTLSESANFGLFTFLTPIISGDLVFVTKVEVNYSPFMKYYSSEVFNIRTLEKMASFAHPGPLLKVNESVFYQKANGIHYGASDSPHDSFRAIHWNGLTIDLIPVAIPSVRLRSHGELCRRSGWWLSFSQIEGGFSRIQSFNGMTFLSGLHGVYRTTECFAAPVIRLEEDCLVEGQYIVWNGQLVESPGFYSDTVSNSNSCDQVTYLNIGQTIDEQLSECYRDGRPYTIGGVSYETPGTYLYEGTDSAGCSQRQELTITAPDTFRLDTMLVLGEVLFGETVFSDGQEITTSRDAANCTEIYVYTVSLVSSTSSANGKGKPSVYPTLLGADRTFQINAVGQETLKVEVYSLSGKQVSAYKVDQRTWQLPAKVTGVYVVFITTKAATFSSRVVVP